MASVNNYIMSTPRQNHASIKYALEDSEAKGPSPKELSPVVFFALQCCLAKDRSVLEVGTLSGRTAIWIAAENPECQITSIEVDERHAKAAQKNIANAGVSDRVTARGFRFGYLTQDAGRS
jgi:predicted O-methyltransferase YrrM